MSSDHWVAAFSAAISFAGLLLVVIQLRENNRQRKLESQFAIYDINRQLLSLGFTHPQLFAVPDDSTHVDPLWERYYLQLWLNQFSQIHAYLQHFLFRGELKDSFQRDLCDFMAMKNSRRHWQRFGKFYPTSFQEYVNQCVPKAEPPATAAQVKSH